MNNTRKDTDKEYNIRAFRELCDAALGRLPEGAKDENADWEIRREWALKQLLHEVKRHSNSTWEKQGLGEILEWQRLRHQIVHILFSDWSIKVTQPEIVLDIIDNFVKNAVGEKP